MWLLHISKNKSSLKWSLFASLENIHNMTTILKIFRNDFQPCFQGWQGQNACIKMKVSSLKMATHTIKDNDNVYNIQSVK
jgi:hypothetical protein